MAKVHLDSNTLIRFFTNDDPKKAGQVKNLLQTEKDIRIADVVFPEIEYVLKGVYKAPRKKIVKAFKFLVSLPNVKLPKYIREAISLYEKTALDMADCIVVARSLKDSLASFDEQLLKIEKVKSYWK